jgi:hypothetical protein
MHSKMHSRIGRGRAAAVLVLLTVAANVVPAQYTPSPRVQAPGHPGFGDGPNLDPLSESKRMKALNADRQKSMVSDTEKLVKLARQLDAEIASNPTDGLTPQEVQKLAAIEKLAHNVKTKMAQSFGGGPELKSPIIDTRGPSEQ